MVHSKSIKYQAYVTGIMPSNWVEINYVKFDIIYKYIVFK